MRRRAVDATTASTTAVTINNERHGSAHCVNDNKARKPATLITTLVVLKIAVVGLHILSVVYCLVGAVWAHQHLLHHEECDMTWMHPQFRPIALNDNHNNNSNNSPYTLYRYVDARDPRGDRNNNGTCASNIQGDSEHVVVPILYIPGHGGNYQQARSLGAHCLGLTRKNLSWAQQQHILQTRQQQQQQQHVIWEVYSVDFGEEGTAWHGLYAQRQTKFVSRVLQHLHESCSRPAILLGHSMGGLVAMAAATSEPAATTVRAIVTVATPHARPVLSWEASLLQWHRQTTTTTTTTTMTPGNIIPVVAIASGIRDEMLPPEATFYQNDHSGSRIIIPVLAADLMERAQAEGAIITTTPGQKRLGSMDHRAAVWCHNLLAPILQRILLPLALDDDDDSEVGVLPLLSGNFSASVRQQRSRLRVRRVSSVCALLFSLQTSLTQSAPPRMLVRAFLVHSPSMAPGKPWPWKRGDLFTTSNGLCGATPWRVPAGCSGFMTRVHVAFSWPWWSAFYALATDPYFRRLLN